MYNDKMKKDFLNTLANENSYKAYIRIFQGIEDLESTFNKDICEMNTDEILTVFDLKTGAKAGNLIQTMSLLKSYVDWCLQNGKIVGAVTHVFVSDPTKGYGVYIDWMMAS